MDIKKIKSIKFALMERQHAIDDIRAEFITYIKGTLVFPEDFDYEFSDLVESVYTDLIKKQKHKEDYLGIWVNYDNTIYDNSIAINTLESIQKYSSEDTNSVYEFIKMTIPD